MSQNQAWAPSRRIQSCSSPFLWGGKETENPVILGIFGDRDIPLINFRPGASKGIPSHVWEGTDWGVRVQLKKNWGERWRWEFYTHQFTFIFIYCYFYGLDGNDAAQKLRHLARIFQDAIIPAGSTFPRAWAVEQQRMPIRCMLVKESRNFGSFPNFFPPKLFSLSTFRSPESFFHLPHLIKQNNTQDTARSLTLDWYKERWPRPGFWTTSRSGADLGNGTKVRFGWCLIVDNIKCM